MIVRHRLPTPPARNVAGTLRVPSALVVAHDITWRRRHTEFVCYETRETQHFRDGVADYVGRRSAADGRRAAGSCLLVSIVWLFACGCQQKMADQPSLKPLDPAVYGEAAGSAREPVAGTVARGHLHTDWALFTGRSTPPPAPTVMGANEATSESNKLDPEGSRSATPEAPLPGAAPAASTNPTIAGGGSSTATPPAANQPLGAQAVLAAELANYKDVVDELPMPVSEQMVEHGRDRFMIYCVVCHDAAGTGHGKIVERGYTRPPSYHVERLRNAPVGHLFRVITLGYGSMPSYASQVPPRDRWAIIAYMRAMQLSQHYPEADEDKLPKDVRDRLSVANAPASGGGP